MAERGCPEVGVTGRSVQPQRELEDPKVVRNRHNAHQCNPPSSDWFRRVIAHFSDHAANERTFLAWVRTAIAVMAFGFLVAKFDLFLRIAARTTVTADRQTVSLPHADFGGFIGAVLIIAGTVMVVLAAVRFSHTRRAIDSPEPGSDTVAADLILAALIAVLGLSLLLYLIRTLVEGI